MVFFVDYHSRIEVLKNCSSFFVSSLQTVILNIYNIFCKRNSFRNDFNSLCSTSIYLFVLLEIEFFNFGKKLQLLHARVQSGPSMQGGRKIWGQWKFVLLGDTLSLFYLKVQIITITN